MKKQPPGSCSITKGVLKNFAKFPGKNLCQSIFFNKVAGLRPGIYSKRDSDTSIFLSLNFAKFLRTPVYRKPLDDYFCNDELSLLAKLKFNVDDIQISSTCRYERPFCICVSKNLICNPTNLKNLKSFFSNAKQKLRIKFQMKLTVDYTQHLRQPAYYKILFLFILDYGFFVFINFEYA